MERKLASIQRVAEVIPSGLKDTVLANNTRYPSEKGVFKMDDLCVCVGNEEIMSLAK